MMILKSLAIFFFKIHVWDVAPLRVIFVKVCRQPRSEMALETSLVCPSYLLLSAIQNKPVFLISPGSPGNYHVRGREGMDRVSSVQSYQNQFCILGSG